MVTYFINSKLKKTHVFFLNFDLYFYLLQERTSFRKSCCPFGWGVWNIYETAPWFCGRFWIRGKKKNLSKNLFLLYSAVNRVMYFINWLFFLQLHNEEVRAFIDKVATMLTAKYPESVKNIVEKFSPSKGQRNQILVNELKWKEFY